MHRAFAVKTLTYFLSFVFLIFSLNVIVVVADGPIEIDTCQELQDIENDLAGLYFANDIDCCEDTREGGALYNDGAGFYLWV
jgi:hypothetical protein